MAGSRHFYMYDLQITTYTGSQYASQAGLVNKYNLQT